MNWPRIGSVAPSLHRTRRRRRPLPPASWEIRESWAALDEFARPAPGAVDRMFIFDALPREVKERAWEEGDKAILKWLDSLGRRREEAFFNKLYGKTRRRGQSRSESD